jgi:hypothetical protein
MDDDAFQRGDVDIQFLERRGDLMEPRPDAERELQLAVAAALAEDAARRARRPLVSADGDGPGLWGRLARREALQ